METEKLAELLLAVMHEQGEGSHQLDAIAQRFGVTDRAKVNEAAEWLKAKGWVENVFTSNAGTDATITEDGTKLVQLGGRTGAIPRYKQGGFHPFPQYPGNRLSREDVVDYLLASQEQGWCRAFQGKNSLLFILTVDDDKKISITLKEGAWHVIAERIGGLELAGRAETLPQLEQALSQAAAYHSQRWQQQRTTGRLTAQKPATNLATISRLAGTAEIQAVFDPYLSNKSLAALLDILTLGPTASNNLRFLACEKMAKGTYPQLTKPFVDHWFRERGVTAGEARLMPDGEHRRFLLLSGGQSLLLGMSLNSIAKNEAVRIEPDNTDRPFFESVWGGSAATTVIPDSTNDEVGNHSRG
jgi:hypothetical protein